MSNHFSAAMLKFPGDDPRLDLTDLYMFASPESAGKTVLIFNVNPFMTGADFNPDAVYRINVDNDGDTQADAAFSRSRTASMMLSRRAAGRSAAFGSSDGRTSSTPAHFRAEDALDAPDEEPPGVPADRDSLLAHDRPPSASNGSAGVACADGRSTGRAATREIDPPGCPRNDDRSLGRPVVLSPSVGGGVVSAAAR